MLTSAQSEGRRSHRFGTKDAQFCLYERGRAMPAKWMQLVKGCGSLRPGSSCGSALLVCIGLSLSTLVGCGNGSTSPPTNTATKDFEIAVSPATVTATAGSSSSTFTVSTTGTNGFVGSVTIAISGLPAGATTSPAFPFSMPVGKTQTVILSVPASTGDFSLTVTGTSGSLTHSASVMLTISAAQDFTLGVSPATITTSPGSSGASFTVSVTGQNGFTGSVSIAISGLPAGGSTSPASPFSVVAGEIGRAHV